MREADAGAWTSAVRGGVPGHCKVVVGAGVTLAEQVYGCGADGAQIRLRMTYINVAKAKDPYR